MTKQYRVVKALPAAAGYYVEDADLVEDKRKAKRGFVVGRTRPYAGGYITAKRR